MQWSFFNLCLWGVSTSCYSSSKRCQPWLLRKLWGWLSRCSPAALSHLNCSIEGISLSLNVLQVGDDLEITVKSENDYVLTITSGSGIYCHLINQGSEWFCCSKHTALVPGYDAWSLDRVGPFSDFWSWGKVRGGEILHILQKLKNLKLHIKYSSLKAFNYTILDISP